jgi:hypothetical protein
MDAGRPLWIYFAIAIPSIMLTITTLVTLNWVSQPELKFFSLTSLSLAVHPTGPTARLYSKSDPEDVKIELEDV